MKKLEVFILLVILLGGFLVKLYKFTSPIADWHSWRQADTSAVSRNLVANFDVLHPKFDDLSKGVSLIDNPQGYRFVEFPIYNVLQAGLFKTSHILTIEEWGRLITIFSSFASSLFVYLIVRRRQSEVSALVAAFFMSFLPYNIYYGRTILPDVSMVAASLGGIYFFDKWVEENSKLKTQNYFIITIVLTAVALLLKPFAAFFTLPMIVIAYQKYGLGFLRKRSLWTFFILAVLPLFLWRIWENRYPEGIPQTGWLFNGGNIRFKGAFFYWIFGYRIARLVLGYWGLGLLIVGLISNKLTRNGWFFLSFILSSLLYVTVMAKGNVQHDYYQILIIPSLAIFLGLGAEFLLKAPAIFSKSVSIIVLLACTIFSLIFGWYFIRDYYNIQNSSIIAAGVAVDRLTPKTAKIIAPYGGDTTFLYNTKRRGWPVFDRPLADFIKQGANYMVFVNPSKEELNFTNYFATLDRGDKYIIYDLGKPIRPLK